ncbi:GEgh16 protein [Diaporthe helianthi]|uniref:GEgh16 protein n=1 Tax=Diaporthe helianthi TaxID=158607 RepID=A0A2P5IBW6_DIAHE|nr:GEgh16 protein [Diaporthe helianthi]
MRSATRALFASAMLAVANAQGVIIKAVGDKGTSAGLQVNPDDPADANFISQAEVVANVVNECGRTMAAGNIDIGEQTETALAANQVTQVTKGSTVTMTINTVNETGQGPFSCDLDPTSNAQGANGQTALDIQEGKVNGNGMMQLKVTLPQDLACTGSSQGNVCTVRCKNVNNFGGCVAVQQTDIEPLPADNDPSNIKSAQTLAGITAQIAQNKQDLAAAVAGNEAAESVEEQGTSIAQAILESDPQITEDTNDEIAKQIKADAVDTSGDTGGNANTNTGNNNGNNGNGNGNGNGNNGNGNGNANNGNGRQGKGGNRGGNGGGGGGATNGAATGGGNGRGGNGNNRGQGGNNAAAGGAGGGFGGATTAGGATGGNGFGNGFGGGGFGSFFGGGKNNKRRMAPTERRAKRFVDVGVDFQAGGN